MKKIDIVREHELAPLFRESLRKNGGARIAVAFWGRGALKLLGLKNDQDLQIICNLAHPGCNPYVIEELARLKIKVWSNPRLHAKIYVTEALGIVGSSNASSNGLAVEGGPALGWLEANVAGTAPSFVDDVKARFKEIMNDVGTTLVRPADIERAKEQRLKLPPAIFALRAGQSLFEAARAHPDAFGSLFVAVYNQGLDAEAEAVVDGVTADISRKQGAAAAAKVDGYQFKDMPRDAWLIDLSCYKGKTPTYEGTARTFGDPIKVFQEGTGKPLNDLTLALRDKIVIGGHRFPLSKAERALLVDAAPALLRAARARLLPLHRALAIIDRKR